jgi:NADPH-dependent curcumin reductase
MFHLAVTCTLGANKALLDRPARTDGGLPRARLYVARCGGDRRARRLGAGGKLKNKADVQHGLENAPATLRRLFDGRNEGKRLLRVAE